MSGNSTKERPFRNGQTIAYYHTFKNARTGAVIDISGKTITFVTKRRGEVYASGSGTVDDGTNGVALISLVLSLSDMTEETEAINVQLFANGDTIPGQPQIEYVAPNADDIAAASRKLLPY